MSSISDDSDSDSSVDHTEVPFKEEYIFDCSDSKQTNAFYTTIEELARHVERNYRYGSDIEWVVRNLEMYTIPEPAKLPSTASMTDKMIWKHEVRRCVKRESYLRNSLARLYLLIWERCTTSMRMRLENIDDYADIARDYDVIRLIKAIKRVTFGFDGWAYIPAALHNAKKYFYLMRQDKSMTDYDYLERFRNQVSVIEEYGGSLIGHDSVLVIDQLKEMDPGLTPQTADAKQMEEATEKAKEKYLACALLNSSDQIRHGKLLNDLSNDYARGSDNYPATINDAFHLMLNYSS